MLIYGGVILGIVLLGVAIVSIIGSNNNNNNEVENVTDDRDENVIELNDKQQNIFDKLSLYGKEIYSNNGYVDFNKDEDGVYYASINDLLDLDYDMSFFDEKCDKDAPVIYFDIDNKMLDEYSGDPLQYMVNCKIK